ncbi:MFS transporter [Demequina sp. NBRC 110053]|uniref:MFS transporter n=1 Tax=Demequina sp. NBRC 110053 TaxID=1570342 RepID=UPI0009FF9B10|nr:MFS transporter [Demequina sp. NBRC 110053]
MSFVRDLRRLWRTAGFRHLTYVRLLSQGGDGMFQVGIAAAFFFDPTTATTPGAIAAGFAVLLAPFTIVGPFVGPLIDRWQRQRILVVGNVVRLALVGALLVLLATDAPRWSLYVVALLTLSVNRFLLAAMTAGLPRVVDAEDLLAANAVLPTLGTVAAAVGGAVGGIVTFVAPDASDAGLASAALVCAGAAFGLAAWATVLIGRRALGPEHPLERLRLVAQVRELGAELADAVRYLRARVTPFHALAVMAAQRLLYGLMFVASILISRHVLGDPDRPEEALGRFTVVVGFAAVGFGLAAVLTPVFKERFSRHSWIVLCLCVGATGQALLAISSAPWALLGAAVVVSFAVQGGKIAVDTIVQHDTEDRMRGRAFTLYDMAYNVAFIASAVIGGLVLPGDGYSRPLMAALVAVYLVAAAVFSRAPRHPSPPVATTPPTPPSAAN